jgi:hypothetical protein
MYYFTRKTRHDNLFVQFLEKRSCIKELKDIARHVVPKEYKNDMYVSISPKTMKYFVIPSIEYAYKHGFVLVLRKNGIIIGFLNVITQSTDMCTLGPKEWFLDYIAIKEHGHARNFLKHIYLRAVAQNIVQIRLRAIQDKITFWTYMGYSRSKSQCIQAETNEDLFKEHFDQEFIQYAEMTLSLSNPQSGLPEEMTQITSQRIRDNKIVLREFVARK